MCGGWGQEVGIGGGSEVFRGDDSGDGRLDERIRSRTGKAARVIGVLNEPVWKWTKLSRRTKLRVYKAIEVPTLMY